MKILGIETSCDETAAAIVEDGTKVLSSIVSSSRELHERTGGIVPEIAARRQLDFIVPAVESALEKANLKTDDLDVVAVTIGPGLIGSLVVGVEAAKALALFIDKPLVSVNHLIAHIYGNFVDNAEEIKFPAIVLVVSGGHTDLVLMKSHTDFDYLGGTLDDAAGEAFDKTARLLGLGMYMGGATLSHKAQEYRDSNAQSSDESKILPRPKMYDDDFDFSFSGLKTSVKKMSESHEYKTERIAQEFEDSAVDVLVYKTIKAVNKFNAVSVLVGGGVAANKTLRSRLKKETEKINIPLFVPPFELCTDNGIVIASAAYFMNFYNVKVAAIKNDFTKVKADPSLTISDVILKG